ncbi:oxidoreductase [Herbaspirillum seropedicae]|uniref:Flavodoxin reductases (Ferredoxin-NADPH reductases) family 1 protein n=1 Tax=Herbaspirillum seropedicae (strain SmR1) TaxID=757424 RepID=D8IXA7_HERSS|nr:PDR/VanB family oxidoreductase [Herbaspirillum seropedicae]ADJ61982.1 flavodoxin reductases (ferredoxin-NADPH reductases) family 1 protein [Herbaspirillum seropedicae SmR1]AKN64165.1 flavodoxin reductase [Herbaspirillum seropedicae]NQE29552.1 flavodoxin reductase [Herbaspirillum seropedicae]UMU20076.1 oxidoreductase [Herbaspirillum seropedicae]
MNAVADRFNGSAATTLMLRVRAVRQAAQDIRLLELVSQDGAALPPWTPGAHLRLQLQDGLVRAYSLCNTPQQRDCYLIAVKREPDSRGGSAFLHEQVQEGTTISASPPVNAFPLIADVRAPLLLAAGIGITPLHAMAAELATQGRRHRLHYFARSLAHAAFFHELAAGSQGMSLHLGLDGAETEHAIAAALAAAPRSSPLYVCGPSPFIDAARRHAQLAGWREQDIHFERFAAPAMPAAEADPARPVQAPDSTFELVLQRSGLRCQVLPGQSIVAAAAQVGVVIGTSCGEGFCGSCESTVLEGQPWHRDSVLSAAERASGRRILPCVSRCAGTRLVLDL